MKYAIWAPGAGYRTGVPQTVQFARWSERVADARLFDSISFDPAGNPGGGVAAALVNGEAQGMWGVEIRKIEVVPTPVLTDTGTL